MFFVHFSRMMMSESHLSAYVSSANSIKSMILSYTVIIRNPLMIKRMLTMNEMLAVDIHRGIGAL